MSTATLIEPAVWTMPEKKRNYGQAKVEVQALALAKKAAALTDKTLADYISDLIIEHAPRDIQAGADQVAPRPPKKDRR